MKFVFGIDILSTSREIGLTWVPQNPIDDASILVQVMVYADRQTAIVW